jgi:hypothetical protein
MLAGGDVKSLATNGVRGRTIPRTAISPQAAKTGIRGSQSVESFYSSGSFVRDRSQADLKQPAEQLPRKWDKFASPTCKDKHFKWHQRFICKVSRSIRLCVFGGRVCSINSRLGCEDVCIAGTIGVSQGIWGTWGIWETPQVHSAVYNLQKAEHFPTREIGCWVLSALLFSARSCNQRIVEMLQVLPDDFQLVATVLISSEGSVKESIRL